MSFKLKIVKIKGNAIELLIIIRILTFLIFTFFRIKVNWNSMNRKRLFFHLLNYQFVSKFIIINYFWSSHLGVKSVELRN